MGIARGWGCVVFPLPPTSPQSGDVTATSPPLEQPVTRGERFQKTGKKKPLAIVAAAGKVGV